MKTMLPMSCQTWGPLLVAMGFIFLRRATVEPCLFCGGSRSHKSNG